MNAIVKTNLTIRVYDDINNEIAQIRETVFIKEQGVSYADEHNDDEKKFVHCALYDNDKIIAYARFCVSGSIARIGRVAVLKEYRMKGCGKKIMEFAESEALIRECKIATLNAQIHAVGFYEKIGYTAEGEIFLDAGISHRKMIKTLI